MPTDRPTDVLAARINQQRKYSQKHAAGGNKSFFRDVGAEHLRNRIIHIEGRRGLYIMLLDMVSYCHHQRLIPLMDAFPMECFLFSTHTKVYSAGCAQPAEREISCSYSDSSCAFILLSLPSFSNAGQIYYSAIICARFTVYSVVKSPLFPSARQSVCQKRRAAAHYKELLYSKWRRLFCAPGAFSLSLWLWLCGIVFYIQRPTVPLRARFIY